MDSTFPYHPTDRSLPPKDVNEDTITDAYVAFILYCNSQFPLDTDTTTLRAQFNTPPRSDNKEFETFALWELIVKFDAREIKTWGQLAQDLGVEPPDISKGQSTQKVQQYTVRLKRWMRAMHVDAFFEYLLGKEHAYFLNVPHPSNPYPPDGRDGVPVEEDTAIRALDPSFKPKRGRRRNSETEQDVAEEKPKNTRLLGAFASDGQPQSAYPRSGSAMPMSAHPDGQQHDPWTAASAISQQQFAPWSSTHSSHSAITPSVPHHLRWQANAGSSLTPATPHPMTALPGGSMASHIDAAFSDEPRSAITPSAKRRRRHGPAVSSAWPSQNAPGAKARGRPPASRTTQDGLFSTFPSNPRAGSPASHQDATLVTEDSVAPDMQPPQSATSNRPHRLSLQVPQHTGGPIRLATPPPPTVVVNGDTNPSEGDDRSISHTPDPTPMSITRQQQVEAQSLPATNLHQIPALSFETIKRALTTNLLRAELMGRRDRLTSETAKRLADAVLERLSIRRTPSSDPARDNVALLTAASWLGLGDQLTIPLGPAIGHAKKINLTRFRTDADGYEEIVSADQDRPGEQLRETYDLYWTSSQGTCTGSFSLTSISLAPAEVARPERSTDPDIHDAVLRAVVETSRKISNPPDEEVFQQRAQKNMDRLNGQPGHRGNNEDDDGIDWKARCKALEFGTMVAQGEMFRYKERLMEEILNVLQ